MSVSACRQLLASRNPLYPLPSAASGKMERLAQQQHRSLHVQVRDVSENPLARQEASVNKGEDSQLETKILENSIHKICRSDMQPKPCPAAQLLSSRHMGRNGCPPLCG